MTNDPLGYRHRPAKNIERHLIVDAARVLLERMPADYQYVGLGAIEFIDFQLMHRALNIKKMISLESKSVDRSVFNKPFKSIEVINAHTSEALASKLVNLDRSTILWFDYTSALSGSVISDILNVARAIAIPSFFLVTVNATSPKIGERLAAMQHLVPSEYIPEDLTDESLARDGRGLAQRRIIDAVIQQGLSERAEPVQWRQVINLQYRDGARMQTVGGFFLPPNIKARELQKWFSRHDFFQPGNEYLDLRVPVVTAKERTVLDRQLPKGSEALLKLRTLTASDLAAYRRVYRYLDAAGLQSAAETTWTV